MAGWRRGLAATTTGLDRYHYAGRLARAEGALPAWRKTQQTLVDTIGPQASDSLRKLAGGPA
jgi:hypothetical protein